MDNIIIPSLIGLVGVIMGTILTSINNQRVKSKETKLKIIEKVFDKRIAAHENILLLIKQVRSVIPLHITDEHSNVI